jgi:phage shock protein PspC (stress-responsive transcriptional regulator)
MSEHTTHTQSSKPLERSSDRILAGVAGGLGRYFDLNPNFFRLGFVVLTLLGGAGVLVYLAALLVIPDEGKEQSIAAAAIEGRRERPWPLVGLGLAGVALAVLLSRAWFWPSAGIGWVLVLLAGLAILWMYDAKRGDRRSRRLVRWLVGLIVTATILVVVAVSVAFAAFDVSIGDGVGDRAVAPANAQALEPVYELGVGKLQVDLSNVAPTAIPRNVHAKVGVGELCVVVPAGTAVNAHVKFGAIHAFGRRYAGHDSRFHSGAGGSLVVNATVGAGRIDIVRSDTG